MVYDVVYVCLCAAHFNTYPRHDINKLVYFWIDVVSARGGGSVYSIRERGRIYNVLLIQPLARKHFSSPYLSFERFRSTPNLVPRACDDPPQNFNFELSP